MKIQHWLFTIVAAAMVVFSGIAVWQSARHFKNRQVELIESYTSRQVVALRQGVDLHVDAVKASLQKISPDLVGATEQVAGSPFLAVAQLVIGPTGQWQTKWVVGNGNQMSDGQNFVQSIIGELPLARVQGEASAWTRVLDKQGRPLMVVMTASQQPQGENTIHLGFLPIQFFADLSQLFKSGSEEFLVVDNRGLALAYPDQDYLGASLDRHPLVGQLVSQQKLKSSGEFAKASEEYIFGAYEQVENTNLYVIVAAPSPVVAAMAGDLGWQMLLLGLGFALVVGGLIWLFLQPFTAKFNYMKGAILAIANGQAPPPAEVLGRGDNELLAAIQILVGGERAPKKELASSKVAQSQKPAVVVAAKALSEQNQKELEANALKRVGGSLAMSLKGPLSAILGHAQIARSLATEKDLRQHFTVIEREARKGRDIVENLNRFVGTKGFNKQRNDLQDVVLKALATFRDELAQNGIKVTKSLSSNKLVSIDAKAMQQAVEQLIQYAVSAMATSSEKELRVSMEPKGGTLVLKIENTGFSLPEGDLNQVFEPFFVSPGGDELAGVGLSVAKSLVTAMDGEIFLDKISGTGGCFVITLPMVDGDRLQVAVDDIAAASAVLPMDEAQGAIPKGSLDASKLKPITGSAADALPTVPAPDEITFAGIPVASINGLEVPEPGVEDLSQSTGVTKKVVSIESESAAVEDETEDFQVVIRAPKVRVES